MSDYPRPEPSAPPKPYPVDRIVAVAYAILIACSTATWLWQTLSRPEVGTYVVRWRWYWLVEVMGWVLDAWILVGFSRSRFWAFMITLVFAAAGIVANLGTHRLGHAAFAFILFAYCVARLFGLAGPRPFRRRDLWASP